MNAKNFFDVRNIPMRLALLIVVCVSFFLTFYYTDDLLYSTIIAVVIAIGGFTLFWKLGKAKEEKRLRLQKEEIVRIQQENKTKAEQLLQRIEGEEKMQTNWAGALFILQNLNLQEIEKAILLTKVDFVKLFEISTIKEQFKWETIAGPLVYINEAMKRTYNDAVIGNLIAQIKVMEQYCHYKGYEVLYKEISKYDMICKLVKLKAPCKKELVS